jgi:magnesium chelatase family protein
MSGPLLDRFDIFVEVNPVSYDEINSNIKTESSNEIRKRVQLARDIQKNRYKNDTINCNNEIKSANLFEYCKMDDDAKNTTKLIFDKYKLSNRSYTKLIKMARTIADLEGSEIINSTHISEAFSFRKAYYSYFI